MEEIAKDAPEPAAANAATSDNPPTPKPHSLRDAFDKVGDLAKSILANVYGLLAPAFVVLVLFILSQAVFSKAISIQPLSVPKNLADNGFTADIAAVRLRDEMNRLDAAAEQSFQQLKIIEQTDTPDVVVPTLGISVQTLAGQIRTFLHLSGRRTISGEFIIVDKHLLLRLRLDGTEFFDSPTGGDVEHPDTLIADAARAILRKTQPYVLASAEYATNTDDALALADTIISNYPPDDEQAIRAHALKGAILEVRGDNSAAIKELEAAIGSAPKFADPQANLVTALLRLGRKEEAVVEGRKAVALAPKNTAARINLGSALLSLGHLDESEAELKTAIHLDPNASHAYLGLGGVQFERGHMGEAAIEFRRTIALDPTFALAHFMLGVALCKTGQQAEGAREIDAATKIDPAAVKAAPPELKCSPPAPAH